jgi:hypothetical protein
MHIPDNISWNNYIPAQGHQRMRRIAQVPILPFVRDGQNSLKVPVHHRRAHRLHRHMRSILPTMPMLRVAVRLVGTRLPRIPRPPLTTGPLTETPTIIHARTFI